GASGDQVHARGQGEVRREGGEAGLGRLGQEDGRAGLQWPGAARPHSVERGEAQGLPVLTRACEADALLGAGSDPAPSYLVRPYLVRPYLVRRNSSRTTGIASRSASVRRSQSMPRGGGRVDDVSNARSGVAIAARG